VRREFIPAACAVALFSAMLAGGQSGASDRENLGPACEAGVECSSFFVASSRSALFYNRVPTGIVKLEIKTGRPLWTFSPRKGWVASNLVTTRSVLFFAGNTAGPCGPIYAVDTGSGRLKWSKDYSSCRIWSDGERVYLQGASGDGVRALDPVTGQQLWFAEDETPQFAQALVVRNGRVYTNDRVLDAKTGKTLLWWPKDANVSSLLGSGQLVYAGSVNGTLTAYDATSLKVVWRSTLLAGREIVSTLATGGLIYAVGYGGNAANSRDGILQAFEAPTGEPKWRFHIKSCCQKLDASPVSVGEKALLVLKPSDQESGTELLALDAATGKLLWSFESALTLQGPPFTQGQRIYVGDSRDRLIAVEGGRSLWAYEP
jgi:outer membrane protein assembly factor BamB